MSALPKPRITMIRPQVRTLDFFPFQFPAAALGVCLDNSADAVS